MDLNEPYSPTAPRPAGTMVAMKTVLYLIISFVIAQLVGTVLFGLYLHMKLDKVEDEMNLREDFLFLRRLQKCRKPQHADTSLLDCTAILNMFQDLRDLKSKVPQESPPAKQTGDQPRAPAHPVGLKNSSQRVSGEKKPAASIHLTGSKSSSLQVPVLQWTQAPYAPKDDSFSYQEGKLKVARGGRFYVYAQVTFCVKSKLHTPFSVYMYLHLPSETDQLLLKGVRTHGYSDMVCSLQSVHFGRVVQLQQGHSIFINATNSSSVNYDHGNTYFGMFELSERVP